MSIEGNKKLAQKFYDALNRKDFDALKEFCHEDFVFYSQVNTPKPGVAGLVASEKPAFEAFETFRFPVEQMVAEGDKVAVYLIFEGKNHTSPLIGIEPTHKDVYLSVFCLLTFKDGKIIEKRAHFDSSDTRAQLTAG